MGFRAGRLIVGLRTYFVMAVIVGVVILGIGAFVIFRGAPSGRAAQERTQQDKPPNIVLIILPGIGAAAAEGGMPTFAMLRETSLNAPFAYAGADEYAVADWVLGSRVALFRHLRPDASARRSLVTSAYARVLQTDMGDYALETAVHWIAEKGASNQPFYVRLYAGTHSGDLVSADRHVGAALDALDEAGLTAATATLVVGTPDDTPVTSPAQWRVPFLLRYPRRFPRGAALTTPVALYDLVPTMIDLMGATPDPARTSFGESVMSLWLSGRSRPGVVIQTVEATYAGAEDRWIVRRELEAPAGINGAPVDPALIELLNAWAARTAAPDS